MTLMRLFVPSLAIAAFATIGAPHCRAEDYPARAVKIIVPFGAGGPTDIYARIVADELRNRCTRLSSSRTGRAPAPPSAPPWSPTPRPTATRC